MSTNQRDRLGGEGPDRAQIRLFGLIMVPLPWPGQRAITLLASLLLLLVLPWFLTRTTYRLLNGLFVAQAEDQIRGQTYWNRHGLPALREQLRPGPPPTIDPERLGVRGELPGGAEPLLGGQDWQLTPKGGEPTAAMQAVLAVLLVRDRDRLVDPFDRLFDRSFGMRFVGIGGEGDVRATILGRSKTLKEEREQLGREDGEVFDRHLSNFYTALTSGVIPLKMIRWLNGWIQASTIFAFWTAIVLIVWHVLENILGEEYFILVPVGSPAGPPIQCFRASTLIAHGGLDAASDAGHRLTRDDIRRRKERLLELGREPYPDVQKRLVVNMLHAVYDAILSTPVDPGQREIQRGAAYDVVGQIGDVRLRVLDAESAPIAYLAWSIPSLGFIGTVLGIGDALLRAGDMMTTNTDLQREAIHLITLSLGKAFDTTLVALLLSIVLMYLIYTMRRLEDRRVLDFRRSIMDAVIARLV